MILNTEMILQHRNYTWTQELYLTQEWYLNTGLILSNDTWTRELNTGMILEHIGDNWTQGCLECLDTGWADTEYLVHSGLVDKWSLCGGWVQSISNLQLAVHDLSQALHKTIVDSLLNQETVGTHTRLQPMEKKKYITQSVCTPAWNNQPYLWFPELA